MFTLYTHATPNGHKISIALEELGLPYHIKVVEVFAKGEGQTPEFLSISPAGKIPVLHDDETDQYIFESNAILLYLSRKAGKLMPNDTVTRSRAEQLLFLQASLQGPMYGQRAHFSMFGAEHVEYGIRRYEEQGRIVDDVVDRLLEGRQFLLGEDFSVVDIAFFAWCSVAVRSGFDENWGGNLRDWFERIKARPAVQAGLQNPPPFELPARRQAA